MTQPTWQASITCPKCKGTLTPTSDQTGLVCEHDALVFPVRDGIPVLLIEQAEPLIATDA